MNAKFFVVLVVLALGLFASANADQVKYTVLLNGPSEGQLVLGLAFYNTVDQTLAYYIYHNLEQASAAYIEIPSMGGTRAYTFHSAESPIIGVTDPLPPSAGAALSQGLVYLSIETPDVKITGQITHEDELDQYYAIMNSEQEMIEDSTNATGIAIFNVNTTNSDSHTYTAYIFHNVVNPTKAHVHGPAAACQNSALHPVEFPSADSPIVYEGEFNATELQQLSDGLYYVNIHSEEYPSGEIRGQLYLDYTVPPTCSSASSSGVESSSDDENSDSTTSGSQALQPLLALIVVALFAMFF
eukprot:GEZU01035649.1.p1 GENE.GEZU01035649.1~~GEZU01035649.1.p1  ORF type:complete len:317 (+),score=101.18 GEZU01035649.1:57-953(+)